MLPEIAGRPVGPGIPVFVIAEIGLNHGGSLDRALSLVDAAAWAGASAVKLQTLYADQLVAAHCPAPAHVQAESLRQFFAQFELDARAHAAVAARAREHGLCVMTTPFAEDALPMVQRLDFDAYKIASGDLTYHGLIRSAARTGRPLVISTGMSDLSDVTAALHVARNAGGTVAAVLHCVSAYPTPAVNENLLAIPTLQRVLNTPVGLSDHGSGLVSAVAAVALGASVYERHLVLDGDHDAIDAAVSSTPAELKAIVEAMAHARRALGDGVKRCQPAEAVNVSASRRGLYAARRLPAGTVLQPSDIVALRPATELPASSLDLLLGTTLTRDVAVGAAFAVSDVDARSAA
jgi:N,N'-diacetyllegionaminate synthase